MINPIGSRLLFASYYQKATGSLPSPTQPGTPPTTKNPVDSSSSENAAIPKIDPVDYSKIIDNKGTIPKIEKHLDDYEKGKGYLSKSIGIEIERKKQDSSFGLMGIDPGQVTAYNSYLSSLNYSQRARFVNGVEKGIQTTTSILRNL